MDVAAAHNIVVAFVNINSVQATAGDIAVIDSTALTAFHGDPAVEVSAEVDPLDRYIGYALHGYKRCAQHVQLHIFISESVPYMQVQLVGLLAVNQRSVNIVLTLDIQLAQQIKSVEPTCA